MATPALARDFKEFLKLLNANHVEYVLIGGYVSGATIPQSETQPLNICFGLDFRLSTAASRCRGLTRQPYEVLRVQQAGH
jgi:hypothetical protein